MNRKIHLSNEAQCALATNKSVNAYHLKEQSSIKFA